MATIDSRARDPDVLSRWYWDRDMTHAEIAEEFGCSRSFISMRFDEFDIPTKGQGASLDHDIPELANEEYLRRRYHEDGLHLNDIADELGCSRWVVKQRMDAYNIETYSRGFRPGEGHPEYKAEKAEEFGPNWYQQRKAALERDGYTCQRCGMDNEQARDEYNQGLNVHHIEPRSEFLQGGELDHEAANALSNLITLCHNCHKKVEGLPIDNR